MDVMMRQVLAAALMLAQPFPGGGSTGGTAPQLIRKHLPNGYEEATNDGFVSAGKRLDMGKACVRFRSLDDLPLDTVADIIAARP